VTDSVLANFVINAATGACVFSISVYAAGTLNVGLFVKKEIVTKRIYEVIGSGLAATGTYVHGVAFGKAGSGNVDVSDIVSVELAALGGLHLSYGIVREVSGLEYGVTLTVDLNVGSLYFGKLFAVNVPYHYIFGVFITEIVRNTNGHRTAEIRRGSSVNGHSEIVNRIVADSVKNLGIEIKFALILSFSAELNLTGKSVLNAGVGNERSVFKLNVVGILYSLGINLRFSGLLCGNRSLGKSASAGVKSGYTVSLKHALAPGMSLGIGVRNVVVKNGLAYRAGMNLNTGNGAGRGRLDAYDDLMLGVLFTARFNSFTASRARSSTYYLISTILALDRNLGLSPYRERICGVALSIIFCGIVGYLGLLAACVRTGVLNVTVLGTGSGLKL
jgi:hypothetical protein